jgi:MYXO-CTERM domain-containing protein
VGTVAFGLYLTHDSGATFEYLCPDLFSRDGAVEAYATRGLLLVPGPPRALLVAGTGGLFRSDDDGCTWTPIAGLHGVEMGGIAIAPDDPLRIAAASTGNQNAGDNAVYLSSDGGRTFAATSLSGSLFFTSVAIASAGGVHYASSQDPATGEMRLHRSDDAGGTWTDSVIEGATRPPEILHVDGDLVLVAESGPMGDALWRTTDGATFEQVLSTDVRLYRVLPRQGGALWLGTDGGAWVSSDGGATWTLDVQAPGMTCFAEREGELFAGTSQVHDPGGVVVSRDQGASWEGWLAYADADAALDCFGPAEQAVCGGDRWFLQCIELAEWGLPSDLLATCLDADDDTDGDTDTSGSTPREGCGCRSSETPIPPLALVLLVLLGTVRWRE